MQMMDMLFRGLMGGQMGGGMPNMGACKIQWAA